MFFDPSYLLKPVFGADPFNPAGCNAPLTASCPSGASGLSAVHPVAQAFPSGSVPCQLQLSTVEETVRRSHTRRSIAPATFAQWIVSGLTGRIGAGVPRPVPTAPATACAWCRLQCFMVAGSVLEVVSKTEPATRLFAPSTASGMNGPNGVNAVPPAGMAPSAAAGKSRFTRSMVATPEMELAPTPPAVIKRAAQSNANGQSGRLMEAVHHPVVQDSTPEPGKRRSWLRMGVQTVLVMVRKQRHVQTYQPAP